MLQCNFILNINVGIQVLLSSIYKDWPAILKDEKIRQYIQQRDALFFFNQNIMLPWKYFFMKMMGLWTP